MCKALFAAYKEQLTNFFKMDRESIIRKLFVDTDVQFAIPPYQRAYSWEKDKQIKQFITDLKEQNPKKKYFLGHFLFEKDEFNENKYWVIDGQQRLTSIVIFFSSLIKCLEDREKLGEKIIDGNNDCIELWRVREVYLCIGKKRKFKTVDYDDNYFENLIINANQEIVADTDSKKKIHEAWEYFNEIFQKEPTSELLRWKKTVEEAVVTTFEVSDKVQATQIFAFQNDRGKDLTNLEKLKAFLMYQVYLNAAEINPIDAIKFVENEFADIYKQTERIEKLDEDQVLNHYSTGFLKGWDNPIDNIKKELSNASDKEQWIKDFCTSLKNTFINVEIIEKRANDNSYIGDVLILDAYNSWPLLLKIFHYHNKIADPSNIEKYEDLFHLMEITLFKMVYSYGDYRTNDFHSYAKHYTGNSEDLKGKLVASSNSGFKWYWQFDQNFMAYLKGKNHYNSTTRYLLWKYENHLRNKHKVVPMKASEYLNKIGSKKWDNTIEHITPQNPEYTTYSEEFKNDFLNNLGNLVLMTLGKNAQLNNDSPVDKADGFQNSTLLSQKVVGDIIKLKGQWTESEIQERHNEILNFAINNWKINL